MTRSGRRWKAKCSSSARLPHGCPRSGKGSGRKCLEKDRWAAQSSRSRVLGDRCRGAVGRGAKQDAGVRRRTPTAARRYRVAKDGAEERTRTFTVLLPPAPQAARFWGRSQPTSVGRGRLSLATADRGGLWSRLADFVAHLLHTSRVAGATRTLGALLPNRIGALESREPTGSRCSQRSSAYP